MRIWDRVRLGEGAPIEDDFAPQVIIADEIGQAVRDGTKPEYPVCAPPFDAFVVEMRPSPWYLRVSMGDAIDKAIGALVVVNVVKDEKDFQRMINSPRLTEADRQILNQVRIHESQGWLLDVTVEYEFISGVKPVYSGVIGVRKDGSLLQDPGDTFGLWSFTSGRRVPEGDAEYWPGAVPIQAALMAVSLLNCSNIRTEQSDGGYHRQERRRLERADLPLISFKTLKVTPHTSRRGQTGEPGESSGVAIHIVRGHFKTYTTEAPLFGKLTGTWWWQHAARGTAPRIVVKDYEYEEAE